MPEDETTGLSAKALQSCSQICHNLFITDFFNPWNSVSTKKGVKSDLQETQQRVFLLSWHYVLEIVGYGATKL